MKNSELFDLYVKETMADHKVAFNPADWSEFSSMLDAAKPVSGGRSKWVKISAIAGTVAVTAVVSTVALFNPAEQRTTAPAYVPSAGTASEIIADVPASTEVKPEVLSEKQELIKSHEAAPAPLAPVAVGTSKPVAVIEPAMTPPAPFTPKRFAVSGIVTTICAGEEVALSVVEPDSEYEYSWMVGKEMKKGAAFTHSFAEAGSYTIRFNSEVNRNGVPFRESQVIAVTVHEPVKSEITWSDDASDFNTVAFAASGNPQKYSWSFGDGKTSSEKSPVHSYAKNGSYNVTLATTDENGCSYTTSKTFALDNQNPLLAPNAFSPNGDNLNETFLPRALEVMNVPFEMIVSNRRGDVIYRTNDIQKPWNGTLPNGTYAETGGIFNWVVTTHGPQGEKIFTGQVRIIRN